jgi:hypothetical protein
MKRRVTWWPAIALVPLTMALLVGEQRLALSPTWHQTAQIAIVLFAFGLATMWLKLQDPAFQQEDIERYRMTFHAPDRSRSAVPEERGFALDTDEVERDVPPALQAEIRRKLETGRIESVSHHSLN